MIIPLNILYHYSYAKTVRLQRVCFLIFGNISVFFDDFSTNNILYESKGGNLIMSCKQSTENIEKHYLSSSVVHKDTQQDTDFYGNPDKLLSEIKETWSDELGEMSTLETELEALISENDNIQDMINLASGFESSQNFFDRNVSQMTILENTRTIEENKKRIDLLVKKLEKRKRSGKGDFFKKIALATKTNVFPNQKAVYDLINDYGAIDDFFTSEEDISPVISDIDDVHFMENEVSNMNDTVKDEIIPALQTIFNNRPKFLLHLTEQDEDAILDKSNDRDMVKIDEIGNMLEMNTEDIEKIKNTLQAVYFIKNRPENIHVKDLMTVLKIYSVRSN